MKLFLLISDILGLAALCILATTASLLFSLWRLSMAGFLRLVLTLSDRALGTLSRFKGVNLKLITRGSKTWIVINLGRYSVGGAIEKRPDGGFDVTSDIGANEDQARVQGDVVSSPVQR